jgi:hypothetical protein
MPVPCVSRSDLNVAFNQLHYLMEQTRSSIRVEINIDTVSEHYLSAVTDHRPMMQPMLGNGILIGAVV